MRLANQTALVLTLVTLLAGLTPIATAAPGPPTEATATALVDTYDEAIHALDIERVMAMISHDFSARLVNCEKTTKLNRADLLELFQTTFPVITDYQRTRTELDFEIKPDGKYAIVTSTVFDTIASEDYESSGAYDERIYLRQSDQGLEIVAILSKKHCK